LENPNPYYVLLLGIGAFFVAIIGWFGSLFTGRMPPFARRYLAQYLGYTVNLAAYEYLLTDVFPPFASDDPGYPVHLAVPTETRLNRWAVFFRVILVIPAAIVQTLVSYGLAILAFFLWVITLCSGWLPLSAHNAIAAVIRYQVRVSAYFTLLVPSYPGGLFGDGVAPTGPSATALLTDPSSAEAMTPPGGSTGATPSLSVDAVFGPAAAATPPEHSWSLLLNRGARRLLVILIILGALGYVGQATAQAVARHHADDQVATLNASVATLVASFRQYEENVPICENNSDRVTCIEDAAGTLSTRLRTFADTVNGMTVNGVSPGALNAAVTSAQTNATIFEQLANAGPTVADYNRVAQSVELQSHLDQLQSDLNAL
jgi:hypothetical protein